MRRVLLLVGVLLAFVAASHAAAAPTTVSVNLTFNEPIVPDVKKGCSVFPDGFCGSGEVNPFGHATETILFGGACGGNCDLRTITVAGGTLVTNEFFSNPSCPGICQPNRAEPGAGTLTDVVVDGTGIFAGASGSLTGSVKAAGPESVIKLSGSITLAT